MRWTPRQFWAGLDVVLIGGGESLREFDWSRLKPWPTLGCNDAYTLGPDICKVCVFGDHKWFNHHRRSLSNWPNPIFTNQPSLYAGSPDWVLAMRRAANGLHKDRLGWNGSTGAVAVNLALVLGAKRVLLLGYDMKLRNPHQPNWHNNNIGHPNKLSYQRFQEGFRVVAESLPKSFPDREILNLGPDSDLDLFPKVELDQWL